VKIESTRRTIEILVITSLVGCLSACSLAVPDAQGAPSRPAGDGGRADATAMASLGRKSDPASLVGLSRTQLEALRGKPTKKEGSRWIYTPDQPGCREVVVSEVVTFKGDRIAGATLEHRRTGRICGAKPRFR
jgi:hypothetical protein